MLHCTPAFADDSRDALTHGAKMNGNVRRIRDEAASRIEDCAGKVESLLDIHRMGSVLKDDTHLFRDGHEQVVENLQHHRVDIRADRHACLSRHDPREDKMVPRSQ